MKNIYTFITLTITNITLFILYLEKSKNLVLFNKEVGSFETKYILLVNIVIVFIAMFMTSTKENKKELDVTEGRAVDSMNIGGANVGIDIVISNLYNSIKKINNIKTIDFTIREMKDHYKIKVALVLEEEAKVTEVTKKVTDNVLDMFEKEYNSKNEVIISIDIKSHINTEKVVPDNLKEEIEELTEDKSRISKKKKEKEKKIKDSTHNLTEEVVGTFTGIVSGLSEEDDENIQEQDELKKLSTKGKKENKEKKKKYNKEKKLKEKKSDKNTKTDNTTDE